MNALDRYNALLEDLECGKFEVERLTGEVTRLCDKVGFHYDDNMEGAIRKAVRMTTEKFFTGQATEQTYCAELYDIKAAVKRWTELQKTKGQVNEIEFSLVRLCKETASATFESIWMAKE